MHRDVKHREVSFLLDNYRQAFFLSIAKLNLNKKDNKEIHKYMKTVSLFPGNA